MNEQAHVGLSLRLIRAYDPTQDAWPSLDDSRAVALMLAMQDEREDVTIAQKLADAWAFVRSHLQ